MSRGQQSQYSPTIIPAVRAAATFGATADEIADYLGVATSCFYKWRLNEPELEEALKRGREKSDARVVESLYQLAVGWKGSKPDFTACCFWLKNRRPAEWRDVQNVSADVGHYILSNAPMTEDEWIAARTKTIDSKVVATELSPDNDSTAKPLE